MKTSSARIWCLGLVMGVALTGTALTATMANGQQKPGPAKPGPAAAGEEAVKEKPTGRLPAYFSSVVTAKQRQDIYDLQANYTERIEALQKQLDALLMERDEAVDAVLTDEQLAEVNKKREAAKQRRAERSRQTAATAPDADE